MENDSISQFQRALDDFPSNEEWHKVTEEYFNSLTQDELNKLVQSMYIHDGPDISFEEIAVQFGRIIDAMSTEELQAMVQEIHLPLEQTGEKSSIHGQVEAIKASESSPDTPEQRPAFVSNINNENYEH